MGLHKDFVHNEMTDPAYLKALRGEELTPEEREAWRKRKELNWHEDKKSPDTVSNTGG